MLAFEDLHWADPTSLDLIQALAERGAQAPLLVVATTRPEFRAPWGMRSHHAVVALAPLDRTEVRRMVGEIAAQHALPQEVVERVSERTGGVPLFVEEVTRLLARARRHADRRPSLPRFSSRSPRASTGWALRARSRRSARCLDAISPMRCCATLQKPTNQRCKHHWIGLPTPTSCLSRARRRRPTIASSTR